eukprot:3001280-Rhodomonas_salina.2
MEEAKARKALAAADKASHELSERVCALRPRLSFSRCLSCSLSLSVPLSRPLPPSSVRPRCPLPMRPVSAACGRSCFLRASP